MTTNQIDYNAEVAKVIRAIEDNPDYHYPDKLVKVLERFLKTEWVTEERFETFFEAFRTKYSSMDIREYGTYLGVLSEIAFSNELVREALTWLVGILLPSLREFQNKTLTMPVPKDSLIVPRLPDNAVNFLNSQCAFRASDPATAVPHTDNFQRLMILLDFRYTAPLQVCYWLREMLIKEGRWCQSMQEILSMASNRLERHYPTCGQSGSERLSVQLKVAMMLSLKLQESISGDADQPSTPTVDVLTTIVNIIRQNVK